MSRRSKKRAIREIKRCLFGIYQIVLILIPSYYRDDLAKNNIAIEICFFIISVMAFWSVTYIIGLLKTKPIR